MAQYDCVKFFFGRFQPPHIGHFNIIEQTAQNFPNCRIFVFVSPKTSQDDLNVEHMGLTKLRIAIR